MSVRNEPWMDEEERQQRLSAHMDLFPVCHECGMSLMNEDRVIRIGSRYYCDCCAEVMTNEEMREMEDIE